MTLADAEDSLMTPASRILQETADLRSVLLQHPVYDRIHDLTSLKMFMSHHVFAVLDFMWLLKRLQRDLCCNDVPWLPPANGDLARFVNEIVLGEETDEDGMEGYRSHFELYLQAMEDVGADLRPIHEFLNQLRSGTGVAEALKNVAAPTNVRQFVEFTYHVATQGTTAEVACVFCFGREDIIPEMFQRLLQTLTASGMQVPRLAWYIRRHIELDGDHHGPLTRKMVNILSPTSETTEAAIQTSRRAIELRIALWDGIMQQVSTK